MNNQDKLLLFVSLAIIWIMLYLHAKELDKIKSYLCCKAEEENPGQDATGIQNATQNFIPVQNYSGNSSFPTMNGRMARNLVSRTEV